MLTGAIVLLGAALAVASTAEHRAPDATECPPELVDLFEAHASAPILRRSQQPRSTAPIGVTALSLGPDVLVPVPDAPLRSMIVAPIKGNSALVVLQFGVEPVQRVTINLGMHANLAHLAKTFSVSPGEMIRDYLEAPTAPPCSDRLAFIYHQSAAMALRLAGGLDLTDMVVHWTANPLKVSFAEASPGAPGERTALYEITAPDRRTITVNWAHDALPDLAPTELIPDQWLAGPASPPPLDVIAASIAVGTFDAVLSAAASVGLPCRTRYEGAQTDCATAFALLQRRGAPAADSVPNTAKD